MSTSETMTIDLKNTLESFVKAVVVRQTADNESDKDSEFEKKFELLSNDVVKSSITEVNTLIKPIGSLAIADNIGFNGNYIIHISFISKENKSGNVLEAPYLVFEGYPKMNRIRVFDNFTKSEGEKYKIEEMNKNVIQRTVVSFLQKTANSNYQIA
jgi:hypothetical protein